MTSMDLEGIGALSAAGVALIAIPTSMLVGRWQMKAALSTAEATSEAGLAQAESAYRAALDAVRAEANAALLQWRRGIQREAYASFLLAANRVREVGERFVNDNEGDLSAESIRAGKAANDDALATLKAAQTIIELEGPEEVADPAAGMTDAAQTMGYYLGKQAIYERALGKLGRLMNDQSPSVSAAAVVLMQELARLSPPSSASSSDPEGSRGEDAHGARTRHESCREARSALPPDTLDNEEFTALLEGGLLLPPTSNSAYLEAVRRFSEAETRFVRAAKRELHGQAP
jgi:tetratricopeptide (TPR) repeat protein